MLKIAVCDDMPILSEILINIIQTYERDRDTDFHVESFLSGEALLEKLKDNMSYFDLIFLDNKMGKLSGSETALLIRQSNRACNIVFVTSDPSNYKLSLSNPMDVLQKPPSQEKVYQILDVISAEKGFMQRE